MKRFIFVIFIALATIGAAGQTRWLETEWDFGSIHEENGPVGCVFRMVNDGAKAVSILSVKASCGCTTPKYPTSAISPGDTAAVRITFDPSGRPGRFDKPIYVTVSGEKDRVELDIMGIVLASAKTIEQFYHGNCGPLKLQKQVIWLGEITGERLKRVNFRAYNVSDDIVEATLVKSPEYLQVVISPKEAEPGEEVFFSCYVNPQKLPYYGLVEDTVEISTGSEQIHKLPISLNFHEDFSEVANLPDAPEASLGSRLVSFENASPSEPLTFTVALTNTGKDRLEIRRIYGTSKAIEAEVQKTSLKKGKSTDITITVAPPTDTKDIFNAEIIVITNDPLQPEQHIRIAGTYK